MKVNSTPLNDVAKASGLRALIHSSRTLSDGSGAPPAKYKNIDYISNSYLSMLKKALLGESQFFGNEAFLVFGNELHKRLLKPNEKRRKMAIEEEWLLDSMLDALKSYTPLQKYMKGAILEKIHVVPITYNKYAPDQWVKVILDIQKKKVGIDIKTTSCTTEAAFITAARKYSYPKQGWMYSEARGLDEFIFVGVSKKPPYKIFEYHLNDHLADKNIGECEGKELISVHNSLKTFFNRQLK